MAKIHVFLAVLVVVLGLVSAVTDAEKKAIRKAVDPMLQACREEFGYSLEDTLAAKKNKDINALKPCFYACVFKKTEFINEAGLFDAEVAQEKYKKHINNEDDLANLAAINKACVSVNEQSVTDGAKGCERAKLLLECFIKEKTQFSPFVLE